MKRITVVVVAALAVLAFVAALGAAAASASGAVLCKQNEETCSYENLIPEGTKIVAEAEGPVEIATNTIVQITCKNSTLKATVGSSSAEAINASITGWSLGTCTGISTEGDCGGAEGEGLPYAAEVTWPEMNDRVLLLGPQWTLTCKIWGNGQQYFKCTFYKESSELFFSSDHEALEYTGMYFQLKSCTADEAIVSWAFHFTSPEGPIYVAEAGPEAPDVTTEKANHITSEGVRLNGIVSPNGAPTSYWFEYGKTAEYGSKTTSHEVGDWSSHEFAETIKGVSGTIHYRAVAESPLGKATGVDKTVYVGAPSYRSSFGSSTQFGHPAGIAMDQSGYLWVADEEKGQIQRWSTSGSLNKTVAVAKPSDVAIDSEDNLWVADKENAVAEGAVVFAINPELELVAAVGEGELVSPQAIAIDPEGDIWVVDTGLNKLLEYDREGNLLVEATKFINEPTGVAVSPSGERVYVVNHGGASITRYNQEGSAKEFLNPIQLNFGEPASLDVDGEGNLWVTSDSQNAVKEFTEAGAYITKFGETGSGTGQFGITVPGGILVDSDANIWVSDQGNHRVQKWSR